MVVARPRAAEFIGPPKAELIPLDPAAPGIEVANLFATKRILAADPAVHDGAIAFVKHAGTERTVHVRIAAEVVPVPNDRLTGGGQGSTFVPGQVETGVVRRAARGQPARRHKRIGLTCRALDPSIARTVHLR
jgi:hypothetical protein